MSHRYASIVTGYASIVTGYASIVTGDASIVTGDASIVTGDASIVTRDASIVTDNFGPIPWPYGAHSRPCKKIKRSVYDHLSDTRLTLFAMMYI